MRNKVEEINRKMALKRESFVNHPKDNRHPLENFNKGIDIMT